MYCTKCGKEMSGNEKFCPGCGKASDVVTNVSSAVGTRDQVNNSELIYPKDKVPSKAILLWCLLLPGIPQFILGQTGKGLMLLAFGIMCAIIPGLYPYGTLVVGVISVVAGNKAINTLRSGKPITKWDDNPPRENTRA